MIKSHSKYSIFNHYAQSLNTNPSTINSTYNYNLEFFNLLMSNLNNTKENLYNINNVHELFQHLRRYLFKLNENSELYKKSLEDSLKMYEIEIKINKRNKFPLKIGAVKKSTSCPQLTKSNCCVSNGTNHRCLFTSIQANVTQAFKNMDYDFDNKLTYVEFRKGVINILFGKDSLNSETSSFDETASNFSTIISPLRNEILKFKYDTSLFVKCPIDENLLFELFLLFDKNRDGIVDFGEFVRMIKAPICPKRLKLINDVFNKLNFKKDGVLNIDDLRFWYGNSAKTHPKFIKGEWTIDQVLEKSLSYYEIPGEKTGIITREKFIAYYSIISSTIMNDAYFDLLIRKTFDI